MPVSGPTDESEASGAEFLKHLKQFEKAHKFDPNLPIDELTDVDAAIATGHAEKGFEIEQALMEDNSPYPEVGMELLPLSIMDSGALNVTNRPDLCRSAPLSATMMSMSLPTQSVPG